MKMRNVAKSDKDCF